MNFQSLAVKKLTILQLEDVVVEMSMPKAVLNCNLVPSQGKCTFDPSSHLLQWTIGKIELGKPPNIKGTVSKIRPLFCYIFVLILVF